MNKEEMIIQPDKTAPSPLSFDEKICNGCNLCLEVCQVDLMIPNPTPKKPPIVIYPGECWYCGSCVDMCPR